MESTAHVLTTLFVMLAGSLAGGELARRCSLPAVVGEIAAGCVLGPFSLGLISHSPAIEMLAELGAVFLLFSVGLETRLGDLTRVGKSATTVAILGVAFPCIAGYVWALTTGSPRPEAMFVAAALVATSAGITARVLQELKVLDRIESRIIMGAAVIDDVLAMLILGAVTSIQTRGSFDLTDISVLALQAICFIGLFAFAGTRIVRAKSHVLDLSLHENSALTFSLIICLGIAAIAVSIGLAAIVGAFLAGMILAESRQRAELKVQIRPILVLTVPLFFMATGAKVDVGFLTAPSVVVAVCIITLLAIVTKCAGCYLGARSLGSKSALIVGVGMIPRGEVGIIVASIGLQAGVLSEAMYAALITMSLLTSVAAPPLLTRLFK